jgi:hypothetical protein
LQCSSENRTIGVESPSAERRTGRRREYSSDSRSTDSLNRYLSWALSSNKSALSFHLVLSDLLLVVVLELGGLTVPAPSVL